MSDVSSLRGGSAPRPVLGFGIGISGRIDPDISVDVGQPVTPDPVNPGQVLYAQANNEANATLAGLAFTAGEASQVGHQIIVQYGGPLTLPTERWDRVTGQTGGLTPGAQYYVSQTAGELTTDPSGTTWTTRVGVALSERTLLIGIMAAFETSP